MYFAESQVRLIVYCLLSFENLKKKGFRYLILGYARQRTQYQRYFVSVYDCRMNSHPHLFAIYSKCPALRIQYHLFLIDHFR